MVHTANAKLAELWRDVLERRDPVEVVGHAILWCSRAVIAGAVAECVRRIVDRVPSRHRAQMVSTLDTIERYARGDATLEEVWRSKSEAKSHIVDAVTEAVLNAAESAGDNVLGFDDEALNSAGRAATEVIDTGGEAMRERIIEIMRHRIPVPTVAMFHSAHVARYA